MKIRILSLTGFIGSGKGTVAKILSEKYSYKELSFADKLKDVLSIVFGWDRNLLQGDTKESRIFRETIDPYWTNKLGISWSPRIAMQKVGTEAFRKNIHYDIWIYSLLKDIQNYDRIVVSDSRFKNEINELIAIGAKTVLINRNKPAWYDIALEANTGIDPLKEQSYMKMIGQNIHLSEWDWVGHPFDFELNNFGSIKDLEKEVDKLFQ